MNYLARNIKFLRNKKKISQEELAKELEVKRSSIAAYESKNVNPRLEFIVAFSKLFNISISDLIEKNLEKQLPKSSPGTGHVEDYGVEPSHVKESGITDPSGVSPAKLDLHDPASLNNFVQRNIRIRKMLEGFKAFYRFKIANLQASDRSTGHLGADLENFIMLMEHLMDHNEAILDAASQKKG